MPLQGYLYHATVWYNLESINEQGLKVDQRRANQYGLDAHFDYEESYGNDAASMAKEKTIHLAPTLQRVHFYADILYEEVHEDVVILAIDASLLDETRLAVDSEDPNAFVYSADIPPDAISASARHVFVAMPDNSGDVNLRIKLAGAPYAEEDLDIADDSDSEMEDAMTMGRPRKPR